MKTVLRSKTFDVWLDGLKDTRSKARILMRIKRLAEGNPGDTKPVGDGICELRFFFGSGYRVYYKDTGNKIIILLCGGDKSTQQDDITRAKKMAADYTKE